RPRKWACPAPVLLLPPAQRRFFFQAEDGIRDFHVTGVQTCALPIWQPLAGPDPSRRDVGADRARELLVHGILPRGVDAQQHALILLQVAQGILGQIARRSSTRRTARSATPTATAAAPPATACHGSVTASTAHSTAPATCRARGYRRTAGHWRSSARFATR